MHYAYYEGFLVAWLVESSLVEYPVAEEHEDSAQDEHYRHERNVAEVRLYEVVERQAEHYGRQHACYELEIESPDSLPPGVAFCAHCFGVEELAPVEHNHRENGAELDYYRESLYERRAFYSEYALGYNHVPCRRYRQELRKPLDYCDDYGLQPIHGRVLFFGFGVSCDVGCVAFFPF